MVAETAMSEAEKLADVFLISAGGDGQGQALARSHKDAAEQAVRMLWCGSLASALEDHSIAQIYTAISDPENEDWCSDQIAFSFEDGWLSVQRITGALTACGLSLIPTEDVERMKSDGAFLSGSRIRIAQRNEGGHGQVTLVWPNGPSAKQLIDLYKKRRARHTSAGSAEGDD